MFIIEIAQLLTRWEGSDLELPLGPEQHILVKFVDV